MEILLLQKITNKKYDTGCAEYKYQYPRCFTMPVSWGEGKELVVDTICINNEFDCKHGGEIIFVIMLKTRKVAPENLNELLNCMI